MAEFSPVFIAHRGVQILRVDLSSLRPADAPAALEAACAVITTQAPSSVRVLVVLGKLPLRREILDAGIAVAKRNAPFVKASAIVGANDFFRAALGPAAALRPAGFTFFDDEAAARDWLAQS